ncbi:DUF3558 domain-containing protein [Nocardia higoensis]|uniref:DUF3558 domain-containing protein n=1 Tax=Nocardia higoensis TaxID=228599 RepID=A0ABS0D6L6_9NOCA|nr:DUF3558 domain-containing protein [Nocardia higoensis]
MAVGLCAALAVTGCSGTVEGEPTVSAPTSLTKEQLFDPCSVPDSIIATTGVDLSTRDTTPFVTERTNWLGCQWQANDTDGRWGHFLMLQSTTYTMDDFRANDLFNGFTDVTIDTRDGVRFYVGRDNPPTECEIAFSTSQGTVSVNAGKFADSKTTTDPCTFAMDAAEKLIDIIPR